MNPEELLAALTAVTETLRADVAKHCETMTAKYDAIDKKLDAKKKADEDGDDPTMAERTAADSLRSDMRVMQSQINDLVIKSPRARTAADRNAFADAQASADAVLRTHNEQADQPMSGEDLPSYLIRLHRPMLRHSKKWGKAELAVIARDSAVFNNVLAEIRADTLQAGLNPVDLKPFEHRMIKTESPGGHKITSFVGNGTIFKQMGRPPRYVKFIGGDDRYGRSAGGAVYAKGGELQ
jgi:hypothetical protein